MNPIRTLLQLLPDGVRGRASGYLVLAVLGIVLRAGGVVSLVPLVGALFGPSPAAAWPWLGLLTVFTVVGWVVDATTVRIGYGLGFGLLDSAQHRVADRLALVRLDWYTADHTRLARQAVAATGPELVGLIAYQVTPLLGAVGLPIAIGLALLPISPPVGIAALAGVPLLLGAFWATVRIGRRADRLADDANSRLTESIIEFARTQHALRAARRVTAARSRAGAAVRSQHAATLRLLAAQVPGQLLFSLASQVALVVLAGTVAGVTVRGGLTPVEAIALVVVVVRYLEPFTALADLAGGIEPILATLGRIRTVLDAPVDPVPARIKRTDRGGTASGTNNHPVNRPTLDGGAPRIEFRDVGFRYGNGPLVLDGLDLVIEPGTTTAIVGPSGSGKSTVLSLLAGLHQPTTGRIEVDGADLADLSPQARMSLVSMVFQQPYLFAGSIAENVAAGDPTASQERVRAACELARVDDLAARLPDGLASPVGEGGTALSGGERQRVSIARALLKPAPVLLVDEATSALDHENEAAVVRALTADLRHRTRVVVAHRLASIRTADRVLFLEAGQVVEDGGVTELLAAGGRFAEFWHQHTDAAGWRLVGGVDRVVSGEDDLVEVGPARPA